MGNLTGLLARIRSAVGLTRYEGERRSKNPDCVDAVARSDVLAKLEGEGRIKIVGAMYHLNGGRLEFLTA
ncbi:carbonic anhydrase [Chromobacterium phragmitis]|uniref:Carbonic anhydrase n=1 Tax=Chromobacterium phragmitis TaxID=2202141 RepID=A0ABV0IU92_9NEIS